MKADSITLTFHRGYAILSLESSMRTTAGAECPNLSKYLSFFIDFSTQFLYTQDN